MLCRETRFAKIINVATVLLGLALHLSVNSLNVRGFLLCLLLAWVLVVLGYSADGTSYVRTAACFILPKFGGA